MPSKLTDKQQKFIDEYLIDLNATQAAIRAGYSQNTAYSIGHENLSKPEIASAIDDAQKKVVQRTHLTQDWVLSNLKMVTERCMQTAPVLDRKGNQVFVENSDGEIVPAYVFNAMGANRSLELLGKHIGMFTDSLKLSGEVDLNARVNIYMPDNGRDENSKE